MIPTLVTDVQVHRSKTESNNGRPKNSKNFMVAADVHINHHSQNETEVLKDQVISLLWVIWTWVPKSNVYLNKPSSYIFQESYQKYMNIAMDPNRTSMTNGWIYGSFDPVKFITDNKNKNRNWMMTMKPDGITDLWNSWGMKSTENLLNALNLIQNAHQTDTLVRYLQNEKMKFVNNDC